MLNLAKTYLLTALVVVSTALLISCDKHLLDNEGDCEVTHIIRFRYELNLKWADAFPSEVNSVNLYVYDSNGVFVKEYRGRGDALSNSDYYITLDLPAGKYRFVTWCGLDNDGIEMEHFTVPQPVVGVSRIEELTCRLNSKRSTRTDTDETNGENVLEYSDERLNFLYHGYLDVNIEDNHDGGTYEHVMYLTKNTNHIRVILQETTGVGLDRNDVDITIEDSNGFMEYNNALRNSNVITYVPWHQDSDELGIGKSDTDSDLKYVRGVYADLTVGRMMASHKDDLILTIKNHDTKEIIARVPVIQYALLSKKYYEEAYRHRMANDQEFLDREDEYVLTFFLVNHKWLDYTIMVHSWRIVKRDYDLGF